jgi:hypothetical protein
VCFKKYIEKILRSLCLLARFYFGQSKLQLAALYYSFTVALIFLSEIAMFFYPFGTAAVTCIMQINF